jgi:hypothetical protein
MLSVLISSRVKYNLDTNIKNLLDSALAFVSPEDYPKIEFLIKYDNDDDHRPSADFFAQYPFVIKTFVYERGEGRHYNQNKQNMHKKFKLSCDQTCCTRTPLEWFTTSSSFCFDS